MQTITHELATVASMLIKLSRPQDASLHRALDKAAPRLVDLPWRLEDGALQIASASHPTQTHFVDDEGCDCLTRKGVCWHRAGLLIAQTIAATGAEVGPSLPLPDMMEVDDLAGLTPVRPLVSRMAAIQAAADEMYF